jgi:23S rRNA pseudouridine2605 synthase
MTDELKPETGTPSETGTPEDSPAISGEAAAESTVQNADEQIGEAEDNLSQADDAETSGHEPSENAEEESESSAGPRPPAKLERLQKILAQAGVASRRRAEELIEQGRVQVNGKIVTELGTKADAGRDHIRVDGKLLQGAERQRYFVLNKPKGFVTTVKDPEGRPTVMQFFEKMRERLYPVGRLDYMSEGLLLVTNDGELANKLTKASSGVEKTYLVKVSGQPTEAELDVLRGGVAIERGKPGSGVVRTAPARVRQVRQGDNPWYEVVLIEGRNRELRKMFEEIGHFVEKIRRVGYGPLVLDQEPGKLRELDPEELDALRKAADGKLRTPKAKELRRRNTLDKQLPTLAPKPSRPRPDAPSFERKEAGRPDIRGAGEFRPKSRFGGERPERPARPGEESFRPSTGRTGAGSAKFGSGKFGAGKAGSGKSGPAKFGSDRPAWKKDDRPERTSGGFAAGPGRERRGSGDRAKPGFVSGRRADAGGSFGAKPPAWKKAGGGDRPALKQPAAPRREAAAADESASTKPVRLQIDAIEPDRPGAERPSSGRSPFRGAGFGRAGGDRGGSGRTRTDRPRSDRTGSDRSRTDRPAFHRPGGNRPAGGPGRTGAPAYGQRRPPRGEGGLARPFTSSSGKPRAGGARPSSKPSSGRSFAGGPRGSSRPSAGRSSGSGPTREAWKPKPGGGTGSRPPASRRSKPEFGSKPGGSSKFAYKGKPGNAGKRTGSRPDGPRPGGKRSGGPSSGKKRG